MATRANSTFSAPAWSSDGTQIIFSAARGGDLTIEGVESNGSPIGLLTDRPPADAEPAWSADGAKIAFSNVRDGQRQIYVMNPDGTDQVRLILSDVGENYNPTWSPDGQSIAFESTRDGNSEIYVAKADGSEQRRLTSERSPDVGPAWSPDGTKIAYVKTFGDIPGQENTDVYVVDVATGESTRLTSAPSIDENPVWTRDGSQIIFESESDGQRDLLAMNADGSGVHPLVDAAGQKSEADVSPDGSKVLFSMEADGNRDVYVVNVDGSGLQRLTDSLAIDKTPRWSPDGTLIAFITDRANSTPTPRPTDVGQTPRPSQTEAPLVVPEFDVYVMNADGSSPARVSPDAWQDSDPIWRPQSP
jgi:TolB protein